jgi:hypothetical protein
MLTFNMNAQTRRIHNREDEPSNGAAPNLAASSRLEPPNS